MIYLDTSFLYSLIMKDQMHPFCQIIWDDTQFELGEITTYPEPKQMGHGIIIVGEYISKEECKSLIGEGDVN